MSISYLKTEEKITKAVNFYKEKETGKVFFDTEDILKQEENKAKFDFIGDIAYTLLIPSWWLKNYIRSKATVVNMIGLSNLDNYNFNNNVVAYLLKGWSIEEPLEFVADDNGVEMIENAENLLKKPIHDHVFEAIIYLYNKLIA